MISKPPTASDVGIVSALILVVFGVQTIAAPAGQLECTPDSSYD